MMSSQLNRSGIKKEQPYFQPDKSYDKRFYEGSLRNYVGIFLVFCVMYGTCAAIWAAFFFFGLHNAKWEGGANLIIFGLTIFLIIWMMWQGGKANKLKREHDFWQD